MCCAISARTSRVRGSVQPRRLGVAGRSYDGKTKDGGISLQADYDFGGAKLTSITGYRGYKASQGGDFDYSTVDILYRPTTTAASAASAPSARNCACRARRSTRSSTGWSAAISPTKICGSTDKLRFGTQYGRFVRAA
jgi:iron complex outermembrane receptor protein